MSVANTINGVSRPVPSKGDTGHSAAHTALLQSLSGLLSSQFNFMVASGLTTSAVYARQGGAADATEVFFTATKAGKFSLLYLKSSSAPVGGTVTVTVRKNGADSTLLATMNLLATTASDATNTFTVVAGDTISVKCLGNAGYASGCANLGISFAFTPS